MGAPFGGGGEAIFMRDVRDRNIAYLTLDGNGARLVEVEMTLEQICRFGELKFTSRGDSALYRRRF